METVLTIQQIDGKIADLKRQLLALEPMHPGSLSSQYHVCGKSGCKCTAAPKPQPHGPYCKLNFVHHGKFTCRFVRADVVGEVSALVATFKTFRQLTDEWVSLSIARALLGPLARLERKTKNVPPPKSPRRKKQSQGNQPAQV
jgi:hypothetical protein